MAENDRLRPSMEDRASALGWHVFHGEELAAAYAQAAEDEGETEWADFFRYIEGEHRSLSDNGQGQLPGGAMRRRRPPW